MSKICKILICSFNSRLRCAKIYGCSITDIYIPKCLNINYDAILASVMFIKVTIPKYIKSVSFTNCNLCEFRH